MNGIDRLVVLLSKLPGIGKKTASRLVYHILDADPAYVKMLAQEISGLPDTIKRCSVCGSFTEIDPCLLCTDEGRDTEVLCVVERPQDVRIIEESHEFNGRFHVLGGLIAPLEGVNPDDIAISRLLGRVRSGAIREVILALNPTIEGDTTALYIQNTLKDTGALITRLASGLPVGGDLEYTDRLTLSRSFRGRFQL
ncbi:MAG: recombination mediator RecR [Spirochaetaceae bacterium]|jgi:recombination protein RecR|nr:recombination mediator RecR [Spirochaetaceae bacterium]